MSLSVERAIEVQIAEKAKKRAFIDKLHAIGPGDYEGVLIEAIDSGKCPQRAWWWRFLHTRHRDRYCVADYLYHADYACRSCGLAWRYVHNMGSS